ncbi:hypothetical protein F7P81_15885 [Pseudochrobactrum saccharolyticum]|nr:hypothetical protein F7P81_15885 [Pseudochrobactrum saccharolyticum]
MLISRCAIIFSRLSLMCFASDAVLHCLKPLCDTGRYCKIFKTETFIPVIFPTVASYSMSRKSGHRFSDNDMRKNKAIERAQRIQLNATRSRAVKTGTGYKKIPRASEMNGGLVISA